MIRACNLQQAELREIGAFAQKLRINRKPVAAFNLPAQPFQFSGGIDVVDGGMIQCAALLFPEARSLPKRRLMYHRSSDFRPGAIFAINDLVPMEFESQGSLAKTDGRENGDKAVSEKTMFPKSASLRRFEKRILMVLADFS